MTLSVSGSNTNNSFAALQSLWQQASSTGGSQAQSDPISSLLAELGQQGPGPASATSGNTLATGPSAAATTAATTTSTPFGPQTLQAMLALQTNGSNPQSMASQLEDAANDVDPSSLLSSQQTQGPHRHHHQMTADNSGATGNGATSGSSDASNASSGSSGNSLQQLLQMQAQLVAPPATQSITV